jgi:hypothetical protein
VKKIGAFAFESGEPRTATGSGSRLWVANLERGVDVWDIAAAGRPALVERHPQSALHSIAFDGRHLYLGDQNHGFFVLEPRAAAPR